MVWTVTCPIVRADSSYQPDQPKHDMVEELEAFGRFAAISLGRRVQLMNYRHWTLCYQVAVMQAMRQSAQLAFPFEGEAHHSGKPPMSETPEFAQPLPSRNGCGLINKLLPSKAHHGAFSVWRQSWWLFLPTGSGPGLSLAS